MSSFESYLNCIIKHFQCGSEEDFEHISLIFLFFVDLLFQILNSVIIQTANTDCLLILHSFLVLSFFLTIEFSHKIQKSFQVLKPRKINEIYLIVWSILNILHGSKLESTFIPFISFVMIFLNQPISCFKLFSPINTFFGICLIFLVLKGRDLEGTIFLFLSEFCYVIYNCLLSMYKAITNQNKLNQEIKNLEFDIYSLDIPAFLFRKKEIIYYNCFFGLLIENKELDNEYSIFDFKIEQTSTSFKEKVFSFHDNPHQAKLEKIMISNQKNEYCLQKFLVNLEKVYFSELPKNEPIIIISFKHVHTSMNPKKSKLIKHFNNLILYSASHEFKSQINILKGNLKIIGKSYHHEEISIAFCSLFTLDSNFNLLRDYVEIQNDTFIIKQESFSTKKFIRKLSRLAKVLARAKNISIREKGLESVPINIIADRRRLLSCLNHIVSNAVKYTSKGKIEMIVEYVKDIQLFRVIISDTGLGMEEIFIEKIEGCKSILDSPFIGSRSKISDTKKTKLTGMGFKLIKSIIEALKGRIYLDSKLNLGTNVIIEIPAECDREFDGLIEDESCVTYYPKIEGSNILNKLVPYNHDKSELKNIAIQKKMVLCKSSLVAPKLTRLGTQFQLLNRIILVIDDMEYNRKVIKSMLESYISYIIEEGENGKEAINLVKKYTVKRSEILIFLDIDMPIMNGLEAAKIIKSTTKISKIMIVAVTSFDNEEMRNECRQAGIDEFFPKPISCKKVKEIVDHFFIRKNIGLSTKK